MAAELQVQLMNELLRENDALTKAVSVATREKAELCRTVSRLEKTLKHHTQKGCLLNVGIFVSSWHSTGPLSLYHSAMSRKLGFCLDLGPLCHFSGQPYGLHPF